jgi:hypothetical protein
VRKVGVLPGIIAGDEAELAKGKEGLGREKPPCCGVRRSCSTFLKVGLRIGVPLGFQGSSFRFRFGEL